MPDTALSRHCYVAQIVKYASQLGSLQHNDDVILRHSTNDARDPTVSYRMKLLSTPTSAPLKRFPAAALDVVGVLLAYKLNLDHSVKAEKLVGAAPLVLTCHPSWGTLLQGLGCCRCPEESPGSG